MSTKISDDSMSLEIDGLTPREAAACTARRRQRSRRGRGFTARFEPVPADSSSAWLTCSSPRSRSLTTIRGGRPGQGRRGPHGGGQPGPRPGFAASSSAPAATDPPRTPLNNPDRADGLVAGWPGSGARNSPLARRAAARAAAAQQQRLRRGRRDCSEGGSACAGWSGQHPRPAAAGQAVPQQGAQVERGAPVVQPGVVLGGADVAELDPAAVLGGGPGDDPLDH